MNPVFDKNTNASDVAKAFPQAIRGRTILITGVNRAGLGYTTARAFASQSPRCLILAGRSTDKVQTCVDELQKERPEVDFRILIVNLASLASVKNAAATVMSWTDVPMIHTIVSNAGVMRHGKDFDGPVPTSEDGIEEMFAVNHLGHFVLTNSIASKVIAAAKDESKGAVRIINISSSGTWVSPFRAGDIEWQKVASELPEEQRPQFALLRHAGMEVDESATFVPTAAYGHSKTCNILFSLALNKRLYAKYGVLSLAVNPGEIRTELIRHTDADWMARMIRKREELGIHHWKTQEQGPSTAMVAACDPMLSLPEADGKGVFLADCCVAQAPPYSTDDQAAETLWQISERLSGQIFPL